MFLVLFFIWWYFRIVFIKFAWTRVVGNKVLTLQGLKRSVTTLRGGTLGYAEIVAVKVSPRTIFVRILVSVSMIIFSEFSTNASLLLVMIQLQFLLCLLCWFVLVLNLSWSHYCYYISGYTYFYKHNRI